ncbi:MAG TPA: hypothetical protein RMH99_13555 [Sandaracinaceae bacterium LLY-WYZ-13_1]|nr:hypothetical protein [Sandaracinaceae bacterium LLY-WYZ-13_1]
MDRPATETDERTPWLWVWVGCGGFALMALCLVPAAAYFALAADDAPEGRVAESAPPAPSAPGAGSPGAGSPGPRPATPGPPMAPIPPGAPPSGGPGPAAPPPPGGSTSPRRITATVERSDLRSVPAGASCRFDVRRAARPDGTFWCNAQVRCAGQLLYGGPRAGYFDCTLYERPHRHVVGEDFDTSSEDTDAAMRLDTLGHELVVRDDAAGRHGAFEVHARVTEVR